MIEDKSFMFFIRKSLMFIFAAVLITGISSNAGAQDKEAENVVKRVRKSIESLKTLSCGFSYSSKWEESGGAGQELKGRLFLKNPDRVRVETEGQTIVIDGKSVWMYLAKSGQVQVTGFEKNDTGYPSPMTIFKKYSDERKPSIKGTEKVNGRECLKIELLQGDSLDDPVTVWVDKTMNFPIKSVEESTSGEVITHSLTDIKINEGIDNEVFTFTPPAGVDVLDLRE